VLWPLDRTWNWWTSCWSVETRLSRGSASGCAGSASSTGGPCAAASAAPALTARQTRCSRPPLHRPPGPPGPAPIKGPRSSRPTWPNQRTVGTTTQPNLVVSRLRNPMLLLFKTGYTKGHALISSSRRSLVSYCWWKQCNITYYNSVGYLCYIIIFYFLQGWKPRIYLSSTSQ